VTAGHLLKVKGSTMTVEPFTHLSGERGRSTPLGLGYEPIAVLARC
ncbi:hypothetical protein B0G38_003977, partial [Arthrobacter sp. VKM Ac-2550]|nr:hypothetical protein [Arthrobacter sp. VKM Ac-2550]